MEQPAAEQGPPAPARPGPGARRLSVGGASCLTRGGSEVHPAALGSEAAMGVELAEAGLLPPARSRTASGDDGFEAFLRSITEGATAGAESFGRRPAGDSSWWRAGMCGRDVRAWRPSGGWGCRGLSHPAVWAWIFTNLRSHTEISGNIGNSGALAWNFRKGSKTGLTFQEGLERGSEISGAYAAVLARVRGRRRLFPVAPSTRPETGTAPLAPVPTVAAVNA